MLEKFYTFTLKYPGKESGPAFFVSFARFCSGALRYGEHEWNRINSRNERDLDLLTKSYLTN